MKDEGRRMKYSHQVNSNVGCFLMKGTNHILRRVLVSLIIPLVAVIAISRTANSQELTKAEEQEARTLAAQFIGQFAESKDLTPVVEQLYVSDFIQRFNKSKLKQPEMSLDLYFMPGLEYDPMLLSQGTPDDWRRFYIAENNFIFLGIVYASKKISDKGDDITATDLYPQPVIDLLNQNPNLSNVIVRKGRGRPIGSIDELHRATETLQQASTIMREKTSAKLNQKELVSALKDKMFKPQLEISDVEYLGLPEHSRIIFMKTPVLYLLMFVRQNNQLRIIYAIPYSVD
jgi:hypothetical protein